MLAAAVPISGWLPRSSPPWHCCFLYARKCVDPLFHGGCDSSRLQPKRGHITASNEGPGGRGARRGVTKAILRTAVPTAALGGLPIAQSLANYYNATSAWMLQPAGGWVLVMPSLPPPPPLFPAVAGGGAPPSGLSCTGTPPSPPPRQFHQWPWLQHGI
jgi:hypothetical protein